MNQTVAEDAPKTHHSLLARLLAVREFGSLAALIIMIVIIAAFIPQFRQIENLINVTRNFSFVGIVAMGMTLVILTGGIDLSVGSVWAMTAVLAAFTDVERLADGRSNRCRAFGSCRRWVFSMGCALPG